MGESPYEKDLTCDSYVHLLGAYGAAQAMVYSPNNPSGVNGLPGDHGCVRAYVSEGYMKMTADK